MVKTRKRFFWLLVTSDFQFFFFSTSLYLSLLLLSHFGYFMSTTYILCAVWTGILFPITMFVVVWNFLCVCSSVSCLDTFFPAFSAPSIILYSPTVHANSFLSLSLTRRQSHTLGGSEMRDERFKSVAMTIEVKYEWGEGVLCGQIVGMRALCTGGMCLCMMWMSVSGQGARGVCGLTADNHSQRNRHSETTVPAHTAEKI